MSGMKRKTIRKVLRNKIEDWLRSIENEEIRQIASRNVIVTGGSITSMLLGEPINDFDIYMRTKESTVSLAKFYSDWFVKLNNPQIQPFVKITTLKNIKGEDENRVCIYVKSSGAAGEGDDYDYQYYEQTDNIHGDGAEQYINKIQKGLHGDKDPDDEGESLPRYRPVFMSQNAISLKNKVQLVIRFYGDPQQIHDNYDFCHAMCSYDYHNDRLDLPADAMESILSKTLYYKGSLYPICSVFRTRKFIERGWTISAGEMLKMCWQISEIDLTDQTVLREQLTGIDAAYFSELIRLMDKEKEENPETLKDINSTYAIQLIDRIFNE